MLIKLLAILKIGMIKQTKEKLENQAKELEDGGE